MSPDLDDEGNVPNDALIGNTDVAETAGSSGGGGCCGKTYKIIEVVLCFIPLAIGGALEFPSVYLERPIPYHTVGDNGEVLQAFMYESEERGETVSTEAMAGVIVGAALLQFVLIFLLRKPLSERLDVLHKSFCVYFMALGLTISIGNAIKLYVGYLRPVFYDLCQPDEDYEYCTDEHGKQGRKSFPSGHSANTFCAFVLLSLFLEHFFGKTAYLKKLKAEGRTNEPMKLVRVLTVLCYAPVLVAFFVAASRVYDNHHHPADVVGGAVLGTSIASLVFDIWFR